jgi:hypothetical protein
MSVLFILSLRKAVADKPPVASRWWIEDGPTCVHAGLDDGREMRRIFWGIQAKSAPSPPDPPDPPDLPERSRLVKTGMARSLTVAAR